MADSLSTSIKEDDLGNEIDVGDDEDPYAEFFQSIRTENGLEVGYRVAWPGVAPFELSTCLPQSEIAPMFHGTQWAGTRIWRAAVIAVQYLLSSQSPILLTKDTTVLELGCGLGVPGMILHALKSCNVILTDMDALVEQLKENLAKNFPSTSIQAHPLDWSEQGVQDLVNATNNPRGFDLAFNCDCIYEPLYGDSWKNLLECQEALLRINPNTAMILSIERRKADGADQYLQALEKSSVVSKVERIQLDFVHAPEVEIYRAYGTKH